jgi:hypothetical protein
MADAFGDNVGGTLRRVALSTTHVEEVEAGSLAAGSSLRPPRRFADWSASDEIGALPSPASAAQPANNETDAVMSETTIAVEERFMGSPVEYGGLRRRGERQPHAMYGSHFTSWRPTRPNGLVWGSVRPQRGCLSGACAPQTPPTKKNDYFRTLEHQQGMRTHLCSGHRVSVAASTSAFYCSAHRRMRAHAQGSFARRVRRVPDVIARRSRCARIARRRLDRCDEADTT